MRKLVGACLSLFVLALCVDIGLILIDDGTPPESLKEFIIQMFGILAIMFAIPFAHKITEYFSGE